MRTPPNTGFAEVPADLQAALDACPAARETFATLSGSDRYSALWRLMTARTPETRARRLGKLVAMLAAGETFH